MVRTQGIPSSLDWGSGRKVRGGGCKLKWEMGWGHGCYNTFINIIGITRWCGMQSTAGQARRERKEGTQLGIRILIKISRRSGSGERSSMIQVHSTYEPPRIILSSCFTVSYLQGQKEKRKRKDGTNRTQPTTTVTIRVNPNIRDPCAPKEVLWGANFPYYWLDG